MSEGFVLLYREIFEDEIWKDEKPQTILLFIYLFAKANHADRPFGNIVIKRGQRLTNIPELVAILNNWYSYDQIDKALDRLKAKGKIKAVKSGSRKLLITVCNYDKFQSRTESQKSRDRRPDRKDAEISHGKGIEPDCNDAEAGQVAGQNTKKTGAKKKELIIKNEYSIEQEQGFVKFQAWIAENCPTVARMKEPFTIDQYVKLKAGHPNWKVIADICEQMESWEPLLKKRSNAYKTYCAFYKRRQESQSKSTTAAPGQTRAEI